MSDPSRRTDAEPPREAKEEDYPLLDDGRDVDDGQERSSGEELLESEERVKEADRRDREERRADPRGEPTDGDAARDDAGDVESEWHVWILGALVVAGIAIFFAPGWLVPELLGTLGAFLVAIGALGLVLKWAIERSA